MPHGRRIFKYTHVKSCNPADWAQCDIYDNRDTQSRHRSQQDGSSVHRLKQFVQGDINGKYDKLQFMNAHKHELESLLSNGICVSLS